MCKICNWALCFLFFVMLGCAEEPEKVENESSKKRTVKSAEMNLPEEPIEDSAEPGSVFPVLDDANCEQFLLAYLSKRQATKVKMNTKLGEIWVELFNDTPLHRANFLYLIERNYYNPTQIVRVVPDFVVQGGNSDEAEDMEKRFFIGEYSLPAEFNPRHIHTTGALAMSRSYTDNPQKRSSAYDFYIVAGKDINQANLYSAGVENGYQYSEEQKKLYLSIGGSPHLDGEHTVFGRVIKGIEVVKQMSRVEADASDWPREHLQVEMTIPTDSL